MLHPDPDRLHALLASPSASWETLRVALGSSFAKLEWTGAAAATLSQAAWLVGGAVRDLLLSRPLLDLDVVVVGDAVALGRLLVQRHGGALIEHAAFGTATWRTPDAACVDLATSRRERYAHPGALPAVEAAPLREDLRRRDFRCNAIALGLSAPSVGRLFDPLGGVTDLRTGRLGVLHDQSFVDDPTRLLRLARFAARLGLTPDRGTRAAVDRARKEDPFPTVSPERLGQELHKLLDEASWADALDLLRCWGLVELLLGEGANEAVGAIKTRAPLDPWLLLATRLPPVGHERLLRLFPGRREDRRMLGDAPATYRALERSLPTADRATAGELLMGVDPRLLRALDDSLETPHLGWWMDEGSGIQPAVGGRQLIARGHTPGPDFRPAIAASRRAAWMGADADAQLTAAEVALSRARRLTPDPSD